MMDERYPQVLLHRYTDGQGVTILIVTLFHSVQEVQSRVPSPCCLDQLDVGRVLGSACCRELSVVYCTLCKFVLKYLAADTDIDNSYNTAHSKRRHSDTTDLPGRPSLLGCGQQTDIIDGRCQSLSTAILF